MNDTQYRQINQTTVFQERRYLAQGDIFECAGPFLITGFMEFSQGQVIFPRAKSELRENRDKPFLWLLPPWSIFHFRSFNLEVHTRVHIFRLKHPQRWSRTSGPILIPADQPSDLPCVPEDWPRWLAPFSHHKPQYSEKDLSPVTRKAKKAIEDQTGDVVTIQDMARELQFNITVLGRHFKKDLGLTPKQYQNRLRIIDSIAHMLTGLKPTDAAFLAGFNDLSRFYKQFKKTTQAPPGEYLAQSKNAKTDSPFQGKVSLE